MKTFTKSLSGLLSASALAIGLSVIAQPAVAGIDGSLHDLATTDTATTTAQICVFCHTPHGANTLVEAPLWNKGSTGNSYGLYNSPTMDGVTSAGSVSLACLTCHDGTQARDNMINKPGSGGYNAAGSPLGTMGNMSGFGVANLGTDLSNDHPIGMTYCAALDATAAEGGACGDDSFSLNPLGGTAATRLWVDTGLLGAGTYEKTDMPLFNGGTGASVECATCHDPHTPENGTFLRVSNTGSALCLTCHTK